MLYLTPESFNPAFWAAVAPLWVKCDECEEFLCTLHRLHVSDCACPSIEDWPLSPYLH
jgi:hypothetical protein